MVVFRTPTVPSDVRVEVTTKGAQRRLFSQIADAYERGINVWKLADGTYTEREPTDPSLVAAAYLGGHIYEVTEEEAAELEAAGYGGGLG